MRTRKIHVCIFSALLLMFQNAASHAQTDVMKPIHTLFEAMKTGDSATIHKVFHPRAMLYTVTADQATGKPVLREETLQNFLSAVGRPRTDVYNELIWDEKISVDGNLAQVWTNYAFYLNSKFNHCGVDAFQLIQDTRGEWLIFVLSDTRHKEGCQVPGHIKDRIK